MTAAPDMDVLLLACTHYPLLEDKIRAALPSRIRLVSQGGIVAASLDDYLARHPEMRARLSTGGAARFFTTDAPEAFNAPASTFFGAPVSAEHVHL